MLRFMVGDIVSLVIPRGDCPLSADEPPESCSLNPCLRTGRALACSRTASDAPQGCHRARFHPTITGADGASRRSSPADAWAPNACAHISQAAVIMTPGRASCRMKPSMGSNLPDQGAIPRCVSV